SAPARRLPTGPRPAANAGRPRRSPAPWSGRSSARPAPAHARCRRSRRRPGKDRSGRAAGPTTCAAMPWACRGRSSRKVAGERPAGLVAAAVDEMVVDHAGRLHEGVDDRRPDEIAAAGAQVLGDRARLLALGGNVGETPPLRLDRPPADEAPQMTAEAVPSGKVEIDAGE